MSNSKISNSGMTAEQTEFLVKLVFSQDKGYYLGPLLIGLVINTLFAGVVTVQTLSYLSHAKTDRPFLRFCVYSSVTIALAYTIYMISFLMDFFVYGFGSYRQFADLKGPMPFVALETGIILIVQSFYAERAYRLLSKSKIFIGVFALLAAGQVGCSMSVIIVATTQLKGVLDIPKAPAYIYAWLSMQLIVDVYITGSMTWGLWRSKTGWAQTDRVISKLLAYTAETQLPSLIIAIVFVITFALKTDATLFSAIAFSMPLPYIIGMLAVLNARDNLRQDMGTQVSQNKNSYPLSNRPQSTFVPSTNGVFSQTNSLPYHFGPDVQAATVEAWEEEDRMGVRDNSNSKTRLTAA